MASAAASCSKIGAKLSRGIRDIKGESRLVIAQESAEFINRNTSNEDFITILYRAFFDREPDTGGYYDWLNQLNSGKSRQNVLNGFIYSTEFENLCNSYGISPYSGPETLIITP
jgi:hypothetical protein